MSDTTPRLGLPYLVAGQAQKEVTHNEALNLLDVLGQATAASRSSSAPPADPAEGDVHIVGAGATGDWSGHDGEIAAYYGGWQFILPRAGWRCWVVDEGAVLRHDGTAWQVEASAFGLTLIDDVDAAGARATLELGDAATRSVGTAAGTVAAGDHAHAGVYQPADPELDAWAAKAAPTGAVVGTTDAQTLSAKSLQSPTLSGTTTLAAGHAFSGTLQVQGSQLLFGATRLYEAVGDTEYAVAFFSAANNQIRFYRYDGGAAAAADLALYNGSAYDRVATEQNALTLSAKTMRGPDGSATAPTYGFSAATTSGIFREASGAVALAVGGTKVFAAAGGEVTFGGYDPASTTADGVHVDLSPGYVGTQQAAAASVANLAFQASSGTGSVFSVNYAGAVVAGAASGSFHTFQRGSAGDATATILQVRDAGNVCAYFYNASGSGWNTSGAAMRLAANGATSRSLNAAGTLNASGADYAEYRRLIEPLYGAVPKGAILGLDAAGLLTDRFDDVVGRVLIKSTAPNLVGNDSWGAEANICALYGVEPVGDEPEDGTAEHDAWLARKAAFEGALETERQYWDRMAMCGVVPCNVAATTADVGKYLVPTRTADGAIGASPVAEADLTLAQYIRSFAVIEAIGGDGRPLVSVKIA